MLLLALLLQGGVLGAEIQLATLVKGPDAIMFSPGEGTGNLIKDVWITHLTATTVSASPRPASTALCISPQEMLKIPQELCPPCAGAQQHVPAPRAAKCPLARASCEPKLLPIGGDDPASKRLGAN